MTLQSTNCCRPVLSIWPCTAGYDSIGANLVYPPRLPQIGLISPSVAAGRGVGRPGAQSSMTCTHLSGEKTGCTFILAGRSSSKAWPTFLTTRKRPTTCSASFFSGLECLALTGDFVGHPCSVVDFDFELP